MKNNKTKFITKVLAVLLVVAIMSTMAFSVFADENNNCDYSYFITTNDNITILDYIDSNNLIKQRTDARDYDDDDNVIGELYEICEKNAVFENVAYYGSNTLVVSLPSTDTSGYYPHSIQNCFPIDDMILSGAKEWYLYFDYSLDYDINANQFECNSCLINFYDEEFSRVSFQRLTKLDNDNSFGIMGDFIKLEIPENALYFGIYIEFSAQAQFYGGVGTFYGNLNNFFITDTVFDISLYGELTQKQISLKPNTIISPVVQSSTSLLACIGKGAVNFFESVFVADDGGISTLGVYCLAFVGIGMAIGIMRWIRKKSG